MKAPRRYRSLRFEFLEIRSLLAIDVTTFADVVDPNDGVTSLREAITAANVAEEDVEINLPAGEYQLEIIGRGENQNLTGDLDVIAGGRTVRIVGADVVEVNGKEDRVFHVHQGILEIDNVDVRKGEARDDGSTGPHALGGGILVSAGASLTVRDALIASNNAFGADGPATNPNLDPIKGGDARGGGIYITGGGTLSLDNTSVNQNGAVGGRGGAGGLDVPNQGSSGGDGGTGGDAYGAAVYFGGGTMSMRGGWLQTGVDAGFSLGARGGDGGTGAGGLAGGTGGQGGAGGKGGNGGNVYGGALYFAGGTFEYSDSDSVFVFDATIYGEARGGNGGAGAAAGSGGGTPVAVAPPEAKVEMAARGETSTVAPSIWPKEISGSFDPDSSSATTENRYSSESVGKRCRVLGCRRNWRRRNWVGSAGRRGRGRRKFWQCVRRYSLDGWRRIRWAGGALRWEQFWRCRRDCSQW